MAAKKKTSKAKTSKAAPSRKPTAPGRKRAAPGSKKGVPASSASDATLTEALARIEARLAALESRPQSEDLGAVVRPAIEIYRESVRARRDQQMQTPWVMAGLVGILAVTVAVLGSNDVLSGGTVATLLTGSVGYALFQLQKALR